LSAYLSDPGRNFELVEAGHPEERSLAQIEQETPELEACGAEVCLDFLTPLAFRPPEPTRRWLLGAEPLLAAVARRVERLWGLRLQWAAEESGDIASVPCFWRYVEYRHRSKSGQ